MSEKAMIFAAFLCSLIGLFALYFIAENIEYGEKTIEKINNEKIEDMIKINGEVIKAMNNGNVTFLSIRQPTDMEVIVFQGVNVATGQKVEIIGKSEEYNGKMEIIAHRIRVLAD
jgi:RecJ-like exonuclease